MSDPRPIGIFDSGIGGLTVARAVANRLPGERVVYLGDTARVPWGTKSAATVTRYAIECASFLCDRDVKVVVVACNTASSLAMQDLRRTLAPRGVRLLGVIEPGSVEACRVSRHGRIGVIGTTATIRSGAYERAIGQIRPDYRVTAAACPVFVPLAEEGWTDPDDPVTLAAARRYLAPLLAESIDTLILGCTHYPLLEAVIRRALGELGASTSGTGREAPGDVHLVDSSRSVAHDLARLLEREGLAAAAQDDAAGSKAPGDDRGHATYHVTDDPERFREIGARFLGHSVAAPEVARLTRNEDDPPVAARDRKAAGRTA